MSAEPPRITSGSILVYRLYDIAYEIDLRKVEERLQLEARRLKIGRKPFSRAFEFSNPPVVFQLKAVDRDIGGQRFTVNVSGKVYDYGVVSIILEFPLRNAELQSFERLAGLLDGNDEIGTLCREQLEHVVPVLEAAASGFSMSNFEEDYTIFLIRSFEPEMTFDDVLRVYDVSRLMLSEEKPLHAIIRNELLARRFSYYEHDGVILNWDNALMVEPSSDTEIADILEFVNAQVLELRYYDALVDRELDSIYESISAKGALSILRIRKYETLAARVLGMITDLTEVTERIDTSIKVTEDVYYAKIYRAALSLYRVRDWAEGIRKKLEIASRVYDMLYREIANKRTELLEFAIVVLIVVEIVLFVFTT